MNTSLSALLASYSALCVGAAHQLTVSLINTPLGETIAIADEHFVYLLEFTDYAYLKDCITRTVRLKDATLKTGSTPPIAMLKTELAAYFNGTLQKFATPVHPLGTPFQLQTWHTLTQIPYGLTASYSQVAARIGKPTAFRAVANANGCNQIAILIPCHRVIGSNNSLGGYSRGLERKKWLLNFEKEQSRK